MKKLINSLVIIGISAAVFSVGCGGSGETNKAEPAGVEVDSSSVNVGGISIQKDGAEKSVSMPGITVTNNDGSKSVNMPGLSVNKAGSKSSVSMPGINVSSDGQTGNVSMPGIQVNGDSSQVSLEDIDVTENKVTVGGIEVLSEGDDSKITVPGGIEVNQSGGKSTIKLPGGMTITTD